MKKLFFLFFLALCAQTALAQFQAPSRKAFVGLGIANVGYASATLGYGPVAITAYGPFFSSLRPPGLKGTLREGLVVVEGNNPVDLFPRGLSGTGGVTGYFVTGSTPTWGGWLSARWATGGERPQWFFEAGIGADSKKGVTPTYRVGYKMATDRWAVRASIAGIPKGGVLPRFPVIEGHLIYRF